LRNIAESRTLTGSGKRETSREVKGHGLNKSRQRDSTMMAVDIINPRVCPV